LAVLFTLLPILLYASVPGDVTFARGRPAAPDNGNPTIFLPVVFRPTIYLPPQYVTTVALPGALCPNDVGVNPLTGIAYVANHESGNVSLLQNGAFLGNVATGEWPTLVSSAPDSSKSFVTNLHGGVAYFKGTQLFATIMPSPAYPGDPAAYGEPYAAAYNPVNGYTYIVHINGGGTVQVVDDTTTIANIPIMEGWMLDVQVDAATGLVYVSNYEHGNMIVIQDTSVISIFPLGWGPDKLAVDEEFGYIYAAHSSPNAQYPQNISVTDINGLQVTLISTANSSRRVAVDRLSRLAYFTNPDHDSVTVLKGTALVGNLPAGVAPWDVAVHPQSGFAVVTNLGSNNVTVLRDGQVIGTLPAGEDPIAVAADPVSNYIYVANENSSVYCDEVKRCFKTCHEPPTVTVYRIPTQ
jgi:DNA-binding beta-propeller fold protein YncE